MPTGQDAPPLRISIPVALHPRSAYRTQKLIVSKDESLQLAGLPAARRGGHVAVCSGQARLPTLEIRQHAMQLQPPQASGPGFLGKVPAQHGEEPGTPADRVPGVPERLRVAFGRKLFRLEGGMPAHQCE